MPVKIESTADGSATLYNIEIGEHYHSTRGAETESLHVFIQAGLLPVLLLRENCKILEIGFGTGLNAFLTLEHIQKQKKKMVDYLAFEPFPPDSETINQWAGITFTNDLKRKDHFSSFYSNRQNLQVAEPNYTFRLNVLEEKIEDADLQDGFDLVYFDAFSPSKQPGVWSYEILEKIIGKLNIGGVLVTYCSQGAFKRNLISLGMVVEKLPGPTGKREMIRATRLS